MWTCLLTVTAISKECILSLILLHAVTVEADGNTVKVLMKLGQIQRGFQLKSYMLSHNYLPIKRIGRGPNLSIRMPSGSVVALSRKLPMVKPKFNISSWSTQLGHSSDSSLAVELTVTFSAATVDFRHRTHYFHWLQLKKI